MKVKYEVRRTRGAWAPQMMEKGAVSWVINYYLAFNQIGVTNFHPNFAWKAVIALEVTARLFTFKRPLDCT